MVSRTASVMHGDGGVELVPDAPARRRSHTGVNLGPRPGHGPSESSGLSPTEAPIDPTQTRALPEQTAAAEPASLSPAQRGSKRFAAVVAGMGVGTALVALAYAGGRTQHQGSEISFWAGEFICFAALAVGLFSRELSRNQRFALLLLQAAQQSFVRWMYSPLFFSYPDELLHWITAGNILTTHHLFHANAALSASPGFPGLEEISTALVWLSHAGLFPSGSLVAGVGHIAVSGAIFLLFERVSGNPRLAGVATALFAATPGEPSFTSLFVYENPALLLAVVGLYAALAKNRRAAIEVVPLVLCLGAVVVTHHLTAAIVVGALIGLGFLIAVQTRMGAAARWLLFSALALACWLAVWATTYGSAAVKYLSGPLGSTLTALFTGGTRASGGGATLQPSGTTTIARLLTEGSTVLTALLVVIAVVLVVRSRKDVGTQPALLAFTVLGLSFFAVLGIRVLAANGAEFATRLLVYSALFYALGAAVVLTRSWRLAGRWSLLTRGATLGLMLLLFIGGINTGWPPQWELLPGTFHVDGSESGVDRQDMTAATWFKEHVGTRKVVACDFTLCSLLTAYAGAVVQGHFASVYYAPHIDASVIGTLRQAGTQYLLVDRRLAQGIEPAVQPFSPAQPYGRPPSLRALRKFASAPRVSLIYDSGPIQIYDVRRLVGNA